MSILFHRGPEGDETRLLLEAPAGRLELVSFQGAAESETEEAVVDVETGERFGRKLFLSPRGRPASCAGVREIDGCAVFEGRLGERTAPLSAFVPGSAGERWRAAIRALVTPALAKRIAALAPCLSRSVEFDRYRDDFLALVWPGLVPAREGRLEEPRRGPGCDFDATFGHPCSAAERERERRRFGSARER